MRRSLRITATALAAGLCSAVAGALAPLHADAVSAAGATGVVCPAVVELQFQFPLTLSFSAGTETQSYSGGCVSSGAGAWTNGTIFPVPVSQGTSVYLPPGPFAEQTWYSGTCVLASTGMIFWGDSSQTGILVGGSVFVGEPPVNAAESGAVYTEVDVLAPLSPCNEFSAAGAGADAGLFAFAF